MNDKLIKNPNFKWGILGICWFAYVGCYLMRLGTSALMPFLKESLQLSNAEVGWLVSASTFGYLVGLMLGWAIDVVGVRKTLLGGQIIACIFGTAMAGANSFTLVLVFLGIVGLGYGFMFTATTKAVLFWFQTNRRALAMGFKQTAFNSGGLLAAATMPAIALALGLGASFLIAGLISLSSVLLTFFLYRDPPSVPESLKFSKALVWQKIKGRNFWLVSLTIGSLLAVEYSLLAHLTVYLTEIFLLPVVTAGFCLAVVQGSGIAGKPLLGLISDITFGGHRKPVFLLVGCISAAGCLGFAYMPAESGVWLLFLLSGVIGLALFGWAGIGYTLIAEIGSKCAGAIIGFAASVALLISGFAPPLLGSVVDKTGSYFPFWLILSGVATMAVILTAFIREGSVQHNETQGGGF